MPASSLTSRLRHFPGPPLAMGWPTSSRHSDFLRWSSPHGGSGPMVGGLALPFRPGTRDGLKAVPYISSQS